MSGLEWFLVIVVVILVPLAIAVGVTLWTLEMARKRNPRNRPGGKQSGTKRQATRRPSSEVVDSNPRIDEPGMDTDMPEVADRPEGNARR